MSDNLGSLRYLPESAANIKAVYPFSWLLVLTSAPCARSSLAISGLSLNAACSRGVIPDCEINMKLIMRLVVKKTIFRVSDPV